MSAAVGLSEGAVAARAHQASCGFECSESIHMFNFELVEKPVNGIMQIILSTHMPLSKPPSLPPKKLVFSRSGPDCLHALEGTLTQ